MKTFAGLLLTFPIVLSLACEGPRGDGGEGGDGDGDALGDGDGDTVGDGDDSTGDGDGSGDGDGDAGDGDGDTGDGDAGDGDGDGPLPGCVIDLDCDPPVLPTTGDFGQDCVNRINQFRVGCHCMEPLIRWTEAEACATENAVQDAASGEPHGSWHETACEDESGPYSSEYYGWATNECPNYGSTQAVLGNCLRQMYHEGSEWAAELGRTPTQDDYDSCSGGCYSRNGHFIAMTKASHTHVACGITESGEIWSVQNFK
jgi:hypothetical protein